MKVLLVQVSLLLGVSTAFHHGSGRSELRQNEVPLQSSVFVTEATSGLQVAYSNDDIMSVFSKTVPSVSFTRSRNPVETEDNNDSKTMTISRTVPSISFSRDKTPVETNKNNESKMVKPVPSISFGRSRIPAETYNNDESKMMTTALSFTTSAMGATGSDQLEIYNNLAKIITISFAPSGRLGAAGGGQLVTHMNDGRMTLEQTRNPHCNPTISFGRRLGATSNSQIETRNNNARNIDVRIPTITFAPSGRLGQVEMHNNDRMTYEETYSNVGRVPTISFATYGSRGTPAMLAAASNEQVNLPALPVGGAKVVAKEQVASHAFAW